MRGSDPSILLNLFRPPGLCCSEVIADHPCGSAQRVFSAAPATQAEMGLYSRIAAVNTCISTAAGVEFDKSVGIAAETISQLILGVAQGGDPAGGK